MRIVAIVGLMGALSWCRALIDQLYEEDVLESTVFRVDGVQLGQVTGLGIDSRQRLHIFHRASRVWDRWSFNEDNKFNETKGAIKEATMLTVDTTSGKVIESKGSNMFYMPHGLTVDSDDNVWVTDVALHQVMKLEAGSDRPCLTVGEALVAGTDGMHLCKPTDVAVASNGHFFVADGYCNSRIIRFDARGNRLHQFGTKIADYGTFNVPLAMFNIPHSLALIEHKDMLCVADRENERIRCFSAGLSFADQSQRPFGTLLTEMEQLGRVYAIRHRNDYLLAVTGKDLSGPKLFFIDLNSLSTGVDGGYINHLETIENPHDLAIADSGDVYIGEIGPNRIVKLSFGRFD